jgi:flagellar assembly protein FliH
MSSLEPVRWEPLPAAPEPAQARFALWPMPDLARAPEPVADADEELPPSEPEGPTLEEMAYLRGAQEGEQRAREGFERRSGGALQALAGAAHALEAVRASYREEMEEAVYALAVAVAQQVVQREIATDPAIVRDLVRRALELLPLDGATEVRLHPADLAALHGELDLYGPGGRRLELQWVADPAVERGGYMIETPQRVLDGALEPALVTLYERLRRG